MNIIHSTSQTWTTFCSQMENDDTLLDDFCKFKHSCQCIFDGPMCHISSGKVKTSMLLIWVGPDGEDIYENFNLLPHQKHDVDYVLRRFEEFCEPICNFWMARFKFSKVYQYNGESVDVFYKQDSQNWDNVNFLIWMIISLMPISLVPTV